jgi:ABC-type amino acid transport substrate-binding protein
MRPGKIATVCGLALIHIVLPLASYASEMGPTLDKINEANLIVIGHRESTVPFSYYDENQHVIGFAQDLCVKVIDAVKTKLNKPNLSVRMVPVNSQNTMVLVQNGTIDLVCATTTNTKARQERVGFSYTYFVGLDRLLVNKNSGVRDFPDLANQTVVTNAGTTQEVILSRMNVEKKLGMKIIATKDYAESFEMLQTGRAKAFMLEDITLMGARTLAKNPSEWQITGSIQSREPYAFVVRKDDAAFKDLVNTALRQTFSSPEITTLYTKWFRSPIPPKNINFDLEMSPELKELYVSPNDQAVN